MSAPEGRAIELKRAKGIECYLEGVRKSLSLKPVATSEPDQASSTPEFDLFKSSLKAIHTPHRITKTVK